MSMLSTVLTVFELQAFELALWIECKVYFIAKMDTFLLLLEGATAEHELLTQPSCPSIFDLVSP